MIVRCGHCQSGFDVPGPGHHTCPSCGTTNDVRAEQPGAEPFSAPPPTPPAPAEPAAPSPRISCSECGFSFIVGVVDEAPCPNCGTAVSVADASGGDR